MLKRLVLPISMCMTMLQLGCADEGDDLQGSAAQQPEKSASDLAWAEDIDLGGELKVRMEVDPDGLGGMFATGPSGSHSRLERMLNGTSSAADVYRKLRPGTQVPAALVRLSSAMNEQPLSMPVLDQGPSPNTLTQPAHDGPVTKSAWTNYWCSDRIDENQIRGDFYHSYDVCLENRTTNLSYDYIGVREAFFVAEMVAGAGTYKVFDKPYGSSTWNARVNVNVPQGYWYAQQRWGGTGLIDVRFQLLDVQTDTFHWAMQSARTPMTAMPRTQGSGAGNGEYFHFLCPLSNWGSQGTTLQPPGDYWFEACLNPNTLAGALGGAQQICQQIAADARLIGFWNAANGTVTTIERGSSTGATMCNSLNFDYRYCPNNSDLCNCKGMCPGYRPGN